MREGQENKKVALMSWRRPTRYVRVTAKVDYREDVPGVQ
jgi:uncharacterized pyridoxamine 5'-phosphate oxidase family protein